MTAKSATTSIKLDPDIKARLDKLAADQDRTSHWVMKRAITSYVEREEARLQFNRETLEAAEEYERTGLHLTHAEVMAWMDRLANGEDVEPPECHT